MEEGGGNGVRDLAAAHHLSTSMICQAVGIAATVVRIVSCLPAPPVYPPYPPLLRAMAGKEKACGMRPMLVH